jgi:hypothetical protein
VTIVGRVYGPGGRGIPSALVELEAPRRALRTAKDGSFALGDLPSRYPFDLRASASGFARSGKRVTSNKLPVQLALHPLRDVVGVVRDVTGRAVDADLVALEADHDTFRGSADESGAFVIRAVPAGRYQLLIDARGFATWYEPFQIPLGKGVFRVPPIVLRPASQLYGHVEDKRGSPVADVEIFVRRHNERLAAGGVFHRGPDARSGADGSFQLDNLDSGGVARIVLQRDGYSPLEAEVDARRARGNVFVLEPASNLILNVRRTDGQPAVGAEVRGLPLLVSGTADFPRTDDTGALALRGLRASSYDIVIDGGDGTYWQGTVQVPESPAEAAVDVQLREPRVLKGVVIDTSGLPIPGVSVRVEGNAEGIDVTDAQGEFNLGPLVASTVSVELTHQRYETARLNLIVEPADGPLRITLEDRSVLVRGRVEGEEVAGVGLEWTDEATGRVLFVATGQDGNFELGHIKPGRYRLSVGNHSLVVAPSHRTLVIGPSEPEQYFVIPLMKSSIGDAP